MPPTELRRQPALAVNYIWALILTGEPEKAETYLEPVIPLVQDAPALKGQALYAQAFISRSRYDVVSTIPLAREALACLPPEQATARSRLAVDLGISLWTTGRMDETIPVLIEARRASEEAANNYARLTAIGFLALAYGVKGQLRRAAELLQQALATDGANLTSAWRIASMVCCWPSGMTWRPPRSICGRRNSWRAPSATWTC